MNIRKILTILLVIIISSIAIVALVYLSLQSNFAKVKSIKNSSGYNMKSDFYKELYYSEKFKRDESNDNLLSLGQFTVNVNNNVHHNKLLMKISIETEEDTIDLLMDAQAVIRNDVIDSIMDLRSSTISPESVSKEIRDTLNKRLKKDAIKDVYLEEFVIQ